MEFSIPVQAATLLSQRDGVLLLAAIMHSGEIRFEIADAARSPGHIEWMKRDKIDPATVRGGFSLIVRNGQVTHFFTCSRLNPASDGALSPDSIEDILKLLPLADTVRVL